MYLLCTADPVFIFEKLPFPEADLREFWFASTLGVNSEILKEAAKCSTFTLAIWSSAHIPVMLTGGAVTVPNGFAAFSSTAQRSAVRRRPAIGKRQRNWPANSKPRSIRHEKKIEARREFTLREAVETFLGDQKARGFGKETQKKYRGFLERQFLG